MQIAHPRIRSGLGRRLDSQDDNVGTADLLKGPVESRVDSCQSCTLTRRLLKMATARFACYTA